MEEPFDENRTKEQSGENRLEKQLRFILEADKSKQVFRQTYLSDGTRKENDAEHSWHLALMCALLSEYANEPIDVAKTMIMVLIHDLIEIEELLRCAHYPDHVTHLLTRFQIYSIAFFTHGYLRIDVHEAVYQLSHLLCQHLGAGHYLEMIFLLWIIDRAAAEKRAPQIRLSAALCPYQTVVDTITDEVHAFLYHQYTGLSQDLFAQFLRSYVKHVFMPFFQRFFLPHADKRIH